MKTSSVEDVRCSYDESADSYSAMMDEEIDLPVYSDLLGRLARRIAHIQGPLVDSSCGSGHVLAKYHEQYDVERPLIGIDLSPRMVTIATARLAAAAGIHVGEMRNLARTKTRSSAAVCDLDAGDTQGARGACG